MTKDEKKLLKQQLAILQRAADAVTADYQRCKDSDISGLHSSGPHSQDEWDRLELLTSRFARLSDILTQKIFRLIDELDLEPAGATVRDRIHRAEKKGLIEDAQAFIKIRQVRNDIAHEYLMDTLHALYKHVVAMTPHLLDSVCRVHQYCHRYHLSL